jgi:hypothetical protein
MPVRGERERPRDTARGGDGSLALERESVRERLRREMAPGETALTVIERERELLHCSGLEGEAGERLRLGLALSDGQVRLGGGNASPISS